MKFKYAGNTESMGNESKRSIGLEDGQVVKVILFINAYLWTMIIFDILLLTIVFISLGSLN